MKATGEIPTCVTSAITPGGKRRGNSSEQAGTAWQGPDREQIRSQQRMRHHKLTPDDKE